MKSQFRVWVFLGVFLGLFLALLMGSKSASASASSIYIGQSAIGSANGADCNDTYAYTFFNSSSNWGTGASQIGPGTTVYLCGTLTAAAGASGYLVFQGNGTSGSPITLAFETGAVITAAYWSGPVINLNGHSYVTVNGGTNGTIQATANGSALANQKDDGICVNNGTPGGNSSNVTIENLTCSDLYVEASVSDNGGENTYGFDIWNVSNLTLQNNTIHDVKWAIRNSYMIGDTYTNVLTMTGNNIYNIDHGYFMTDNDSGGTATASGWLIYGNTFGSMANWDNTADDNHHDWIHLATNSTTSKFSGFYIYNNTFSGDVGLNANAGLFGDPSGGTSNITGVYYFNNVMVNTATDHCFANGFISWYLSGALTEVNNTFISDDTGGCTNNKQSTPGDNGMSYEASINLIQENNVMETMKDNFVYTADASSVTTVNYNDYYTGGGWTWLASETSAFSTWKTACSCDANSITSSPNLSATYVPDSGSPVIQAGVNLYSTCNGQANPGLGALCSDRNGVARPTSGAWDIGASQYATATVVPPTGLTATPH